MSVHPATDSYLINQALQRCLQLLQASPSFAPLVSIRAQLEYVLSIVDNSNLDRSRLREIVIGQYAAREFEDRDMAFANMLYEVTGIVNDLKHNSS